MISLDIPIDVILRKVAGSCPAGRATCRFDKDSEHCSREDRVFLVCMSGSVEDEHHFLFDCPAYSHILKQYTHLFHQAATEDFSGY